MVGQSDLESVDAVVLWNDAVGENRAIAQDAHAIGKPVFVIQHGFYSSKDTEYGENKTTPLGSHHLLWSPYHSELFQRDGVAPQNITITGSTLYPFLRPHGSDGETVVFAPTHLGPQEPNEKNRTEAAAVWAALQAIPNIHPVAKLVAGEHRSTDFAGTVVSSSLTAANHVPAIIKLLRTAAVAVVQEESTFAFLAYAMNVPVIKIKNHYPRFSQACSEVEMDELAQAVNEAIKNPTALEEARLEVTVKMGGYPEISRPVQMVVDAINARLEVPACV